ncbi:choline/ethanolamine kinase--aminoglycoside phosphotransferase [Pseudomonas syringae pv. pisi str. PP1]|uniref:choline kinase family protein n=1 Tax=Pseudomonas syringae TaxID=317 RepID=UPI0003FE4EFE|nr:choline kinase family protein [Pseudomonas syringae]AZG86311.1 choline/ethanolamine kinase--aminoglycoside phosphotransferase [Pseudomonas syringae pv. pisi str. PP1]RMM25998.1 Choline/ethanolamine kinase [Pseudomonas syringae pv. pisi]UZS64732.1 choline kinase family protein [Pseudomonas syringae]
MKTLGQSVSTQERQLEAAVRSIDSWQGRRVGYEPVSGGISNTNWRVEVEGADTAYFFKVPGVGTEMFIDRHTAHEASMKAAQTGYGAPVFAFLEAFGVEVFEFMEGWRASSNHDFLQRDIRHSALHGLKAFNDQPLLQQTKTVFDMIAEHQSQVAELKGIKPQDDDWLCLQYQRAKAALQASGIDLAPCMNDTLAGNFMLNADRQIRLVDFEYASNNDRHYELALWFGEMFFSDDMELALIEDYFGQVSAQTVARIKLNKALADIKWSTWAMVQHAVSQLDFDFYKYGTWKHMRARSIINNSQWETWLRQV